MSEHEADAKQQLDESLTAIVDGLERILDASPNDHATLELLAYIYEYVGDAAKVREYLLRLGTAIVTDGDSDQAAYICERMAEYGLHQDPQGGSDLYELLMQLVHDLEVAGVAEKPLTTGDAEGEFSVMDELDFAWQLFQAGELTENEYSRVAHDMYEMASDRHLSTVSVLHVLHAQAFGGMERVMAYVAEHMRVPIISLKSFSIPDGAKTLLPLEFAIRNGAVVFDFIGNDALVAVMNPVNSRLKRQIAAKLQRKCHFYITLPEDLDAVIEGIKI